MTRHRSFEWVQERRRTGSSRSHGFTLLEAAFVLLIAAILLAAGVPSYRQMLQTQRMRLAAENLQKDLQNARLLSAEGHALISFRSSPGNWCWGVSLNTPCDCSSQMCGISTQRSSSYAGVLLVHSSDADFEAGTGRVASYGVTEFGTDRGGQVGVSLSVIGRATLCGKDAVKSPPCP